MQTFMNPNSVPGLSTIIENGAKNVAKRVVDTASHKITPRFKMEQRRALPGEVKLASGDSFKKETKNATMCPVTPSSTCMVDF